MSSYGLSARQIRDCAKVTGQNVEEILSDVESDKRDKFGRVPKEQRTWTDGDTTIVFDSGWEMRRWTELLLLLRAGEIYDIRRQVRYPLVNDEATGFTLDYIADFVYMEKRTEKKVVEDVKGFVSKTYEQKRKLMLKVWKIEIKEIRYADRSL
jgi:hypothetical protein